MFGAGTTGSEAMLIGEQPGDRGDISGEPFVGPAGRLLDEALESAGIDRSKAYVTNAVKHFKWEERATSDAYTRGPTWKRCGCAGPWLEAEVRAVNPRVIVAPGATAAQSLLGKGFRVTKQRGELFESPLAEWVTATVHPSSILRARDDDAHQTEMAAFVDDLKGVASILRRLTQLLPPDRRGCRPGRRRYFLAGALVMLATAWAIVSNPPTGSPPRCTRSTGRSRERSASRSPSAWACINTSKP